MMIDDELVTICDRSLVEEKMCKSLNHFRDVTKML